MPIAPSAITPGIDHSSHGSRLPGTVSSSCSSGPFGASLEPALGDGEDDGDDDGELDGELDGEPDGAADGEADGAGAGGWIRRTRAPGSATWRTTDRAPSLLSR